MDTKNLSDQLVYFQANKRPKSVGDDKILVLEARAELTITFILRAGS